jgi:hypothetical protein
MRDRAFWVLVALMELLIVALVFSPSQNPQPATAGQLPTATAPKVSAPVVAPPAIAASAGPVPVTSVRTGVAQLSPAEKKSKTEVPIQEGKTIDFSSGVAVVKDDAKQKATIDKAVKDMEDALKNVTFAPPSAQKEAEPTPAPPKP